MTFLSRHVVTIATPMCLFKSTCIALRSAMHHWSESPINLKREVMAGSYRIMKLHILKTALQNCVGSLIDTVQLSALITSLLNISTDWRWKLTTILTIWTNPYENCMMVFYLPGIDIYESLGQKMALKFHEGPSATNMFEMILTDKKNCEEGILCFCNPGFFISLLFYWQWLTKLTDYIFIIVLAPHKALFQTRNIQNI